MPKPFPNVFSHDKTSLLRRLQAQTLTDATPPIGKILFYFIAGRAISNRLGVAAP